MGWAPLIQEEPRALLLARADAGPDPSQVVAAGVGPGSLQVVHQPRDGLGPGEHEHAGHAASPVEGRARLDLDPSIEQADQAPGQLRATRLERGADAGHQAIEVVGASPGCQEGLLGSVVGGGERGVHGDCVSPPQVEYPSISSWQREMASPGPWFSDRLKHCWAVRSRS
jgi:hypothetical protein